MRPAATPHDRLLARRSEILHRFREARLLAEEVTATPSAEAIDNANDQWDARVLSRYGDAESRQLVAVEAALARIIDGTYGMCSRCGLTINPARLVAMPEAAMCAACASWMEHQQRL